MDKKWKIAGALAVLLVAVGGIGAAFAYMGNQSVRGPNYSEERHEAMASAFESGDYSAWVALMSGVAGRNGREPKILSVVNSENFGEFAAARESGDLTAFRAKYGLGQGKMRNGSGEGRRLRGQIAGNYPCGTN